MKKPFSKNQGINGIGEGISFWRMPKTPVRVKEIAWIVWSTERGFEAQQDGSDLQVATYNLFKGKIGSMVSAFYNGMQAPLPSRYNLPLTQIPILKNKL